MDEVKSGAQGQEQIRVDQTGARTTYSNFILVSTGPEEFMITFGLLTGDDKTVRVSDKMVLSPKNAKRLAMALSQGIMLYEEKIGPINVGPAGEGQKK